MLKNICLQGVVLLGVFVGLLYCDQTVGATKVVNAWASGSADDEEFIYINGKKAAWWNAQSITVTAIPPDMFSSSNVLAIENKDNGAQGMWVTWVISITLDDGKQVCLSSNDPDEYKNLIILTGLPDAPADWLKMNFDDSGWKDQPYAHNVSWVNYPLNPCTCTKAMGFCENDACSASKNPGDRVYSRKKFDLWPSETPTPPPPLTDTKTLTPEKTSTYTSVPSNTFTPLPTATPPPAATLPPTSTVPPTKVPTAVPTLTSVDTATAVPPSPTFTL